MPTEKTRHSPTARGGQFLTFRIGAEEYGIDILRVQEIRSYEAVTPVPNAPRHIKGVLNLRGDVVPVVDLRLKLGVADVTYNELTVVMFLNISSRVIGAVVDSVSEVTMIDDRQISALPDLADTNTNGIFNGLGALDERMILLVDVNRMMNAEDTLAIMEETLTA